MYFSVQTDQKMYLDSLLNAELMSLKAMDLTLCTSNANKDKLEHTVPLLDNNGHTTINYFLFFYATTTYRGFYIEGHDIS